MRLNSILHDLFRDTPLDYILRAQICTQICIFGIFGHISHIWPYFAYLSMYLGEFRFNKNPPSPGHCWSSSIFRCGKCQLYSW